MPTGKKLYSNLTPIGSVDALAKHLGVATSELLDISNSVDDLWKPGKILKKKNGDKRPTIDAEPPLKLVHEKIKTKILKRVTYPRYLLGGIADQFFSRDYKAHAAIHAGKKYLIEEDVKDFFPNTSSKIVHSIWQRFFDFPPAVAEVLTKITTLNDSLPQGWKTSGYLANLAFWDREEDLVDRLSKRGMTYSRFMDDITVSANFKLRQNEKTFIVSEIYKILFATGYSPKRTKHQILSSAKRMTVTGLIVNTKKPTLSQAEKNKIRAAVKECEVRATSNQASHAYKKMWDSASGRVGKLKRFHPGKAAELRSRLSKVKPILSKP